MDTSTPILSYEDSPVRDRVTIEKRDGVVRVSTPALIVGGTYDVFEVSRSAVEFRRFKRGQLYASWTFRRDRVAPIHVYSGRDLIIPLIGGETIVSHLPASNGEAQRAADELNQAVLEDRRSIDRSLPDAMNNLEAGRTPRERSTRAAVLAVSGVVAAVAIGAFVGHQAHDPAIGWTVGFYAFIVLVMPVGILVGTQKKDYWQ